MTLHHCCWYQYRTLHFSSFTTC